MEARFFVWIDDTGAVRNTRFIGKVPEYAIDNMIGCESITMMYAVDEFVRNAIEKTNLANAIYNDEKTAKLEQEWKRSALMIGNRMEQIEMQKSIIRALYQNIEKWVTTIAVELLRQPASAVHSPELRNAIAEMLECVEDKKFNDKQVE